MIAGSLLIPALSAIVVFLLYMVMMQVATAQGTTRERILRLAGMKSKDKKNLNPGDPLRQEQEMSQLAVVLEQMLRMMKINVEAFRKSHQMQFYRAGIHSPDAPVFFLFFKRIGSIFFILFAVMFVMNAETGMHRILFFMLAITCTVIGTLGPNMLLKSKTEKREKVLQRSFPDALDLLLVCVESGLALDGAFARVCKELGRAHPMITQEFNRTRLELTMLNDRTLALENLAERTNMIPFRALVTSLLQSERFGTSLTDTLRVLSEDFRHKRLMTAEEKAGRLPVLMTLPLITLLLPALLLIILGPAILGVMAAIAR